MKNMTKALALSLGLSILVSGCGKSIELTTEKIPKAVAVQEAKVETKINYLNYVGTIRSETVKKLGFTVAGRLSSVSVKKGTIVTKGQLLAVLEKQKYQIGVNASKAQVEAALANLEKASKALAYLKVQIEKNGKLLAEEAISQSAYDELELKYEMATNDFNMAQAQFNQSSEGLKQSSSTLNDTKLISDLSGKVIDVLYKKGEIVAAGYPVIVMQNNDQIFSFGVSQKDYGALKIGMAIILTVNEKQVKGKIMTISDSPDQTTRTYEVQVLLADGQFPLGAIGEIQIPNGQCKGVVVPLNVILSGEYDFVFVVENNKAVKKKVEIIEIDENYAVIKGINGGEKIVVSGVKNIDNADDVKVQ